MAVLPMEGCDCRPDGGPSELFTRRYHRFAEGGAGLLWWEACAVVPEGRANPLQMWMTEDNAADYAAVLADCNAAAVKANGATPVNILQLTHSGRYSRPVGHSYAPIIPQHDPLLDPRVGIDTSHAVATDEYLDSLVDCYVKSALLAQQAGFDGVDIKACHRYLLSELLASHTRPGKYGGSFENRTHLFLDIVRAVRAAVRPDFIIASRMNVHDMHPYPYAFGTVAVEGSMDYDPTEPVKLAKLLEAEGVGLMGASASNPYYIQVHRGRPYCQPAMGTPTADEHPLVSTGAIFGYARDIQSAVSIPVVGGGYSWLRQYMAHTGAANLAAGDCAFVGFGRQAFAYPDAPRDIIRNGEMNPGKVCIACSKCTQIMRDHGRTGCVIRDSGVYAPLLKEAREDAEKRAMRAMKN